MIPTDPVEHIDAAVRAGIAIATNARNRGGAVCEALLGAQLDDETLIDAIGEHADEADRGSARCAALWLRLSDDERSEAHGHLCDELARRL